MTAVGLVVFLAIRRPLSHVTPVPDLDAIYHPLGRRLRALAVRGAGAVEDGVNRLGTGIQDVVASLLVGEYGGRSPASLAAGRPLGTGLLAVVLVLVGLVVVVLV